LISRPFQVNSTLTTILTAPTKVPIFSAVLTPAKVSTQAGGWVRKLRKGESAVDSPCAASKHATQKTNSAMTSDHQRRVSPSCSVDASVHQTVEPSTSSKQYGRDLAHRQGTRRLRAKQRKDWFKGFKCDYCVEPRHSLIR
jgi:hypothetical protein